jgi:hypothetical protein
MSAADLLDLLDLFQALHNCTEGQQQGRRDMQMVEREQSGEAAKAARYADGE